MSFLSKITFWKNKEDKRKLELHKKSELQSKVESDFKEYILIQNKTSTLPKKQMDLITARINAYIALGYIKVSEDEK